MAPATGPSSSGRFGLAKGPLGIVLAALFLVEAVMALVVRSPDLAPADASFLIYAMVFLAVGALCGFFVVWIWFPNKLYPPDQFKDEKIWFAAVVSKNLQPSAPLPFLGRVEKPDETANAVSEEPLGRSVGMNVPDQYLISSAEEMKEGNVTSTYIRDLTSHLLRGDWGYLIVDVGENRNWLISRLFIFASMYRAMRTLPCVVFVQTDSVRRKLLGVADTTRVCSTLAKLFPWFNETLANILTKKKIPIFDSGTLDQELAVEVMIDFIHALQTTDDRSEDPEWSRLSHELWEHSQWLTTKLVGSDMASAMFDPRAAFFRRPEGMSDRELGIEIVGRSSPFVALIGEQGEFRELYDRQRLFERLKNRLVETAARVA